MAILKAPSNLRVELMPRNKRYQVELRDYKSAVTIGFEPHEALGIAKKLILAVAGTDRQAAIAALTAAAEQIA